MLEKKPLQVLWAAVKEENQDFFFKFFKVTPVLAVNIYNIFSLLRTNYNHNIKNSKDNDHDRARKKTPTCLLNKFGLLFFLFMCEVHMAL